MDRHAIVHGPRGGGPPCDAAMLRVVATLGMVARLRMVAGRMMSNMMRGQVVPVAALAWSSCPEPSECGVRSVVCVASGAVEFGARSGRSSCQAPSAASDWFDRAEACPCWAGRSAPWRWSPAASLQEQGSVSFCFSPSALFGPRIERPWERRVPLTFCNVPAFRRRRGERLRIDCRPGILGAEAGGCRLSRLVVVTHEFDQFTRWRRWPWPTKHSPYTLFDVLRSPWRRWGTAGV